MARTTRTHPQKTVHKNPTALTLPGWSSHTLYHYHLLTLMLILQISKSYTWRLCVDSRAGGGKVDALGRTLKKSSWWITQQLGKIFTSRLVRVVFPPLVTLPTGRKEKICIHFISFHFISSHILWSQTNQAFDLPAYSNDPLHYGASWVSSWSLQWQETHDGQISRRQKERKKERKS